MPNRNGPVHVATTRRTVNGKTYQTHLLRRTYRHQGKVKHQTLGNISHLPPGLIEIIRRYLKGETDGSPEGAWEIVRSLPHGHVKVVLGVLRDIGMENMLASRPSRERKLVTAMIVQRLINPASKLATASALSEETAQTSLSLELGLGNVNEDELYKALDWLLAKQQRIENKLAKKQLADGVLVLYDVSGSYYTGRCSSLVKHGYNRDGKRGFPQIVYGLLCNAKGCPVSIEVFAGNTADPKTLSSQINKIRKRFGIKRVVLVGDRGMITSKRIDEELRDVEGLDWITALRSDGIRKLVNQGAVQLSLFDERDLVEVTSPDYPGERLVVCRNPLLADSRARKRNELLAATEEKLNAIVTATERKRNPYRGKEKIALRVGKVINKYKMGKHFELEFSETSFSFCRKEEQIAEEAALDGLYVIRTSVAETEFSSVETVRTYKNLSQVERAFRSLKTVDLQIRPIFHHTDDRIRGHVFLCMLTYYVEWHLRQRLALLLFDDHDRKQAQEQRTSIVAAALRSDAALKKDRTKRTAAGDRVHSFQSLLANLGTQCQNLIRPQGSDAEFYLQTQPTPLQQKAFDLLTPAD